MTPIGVGIIGVGPDGGWAAATHVPNLTGNIPATGLMLAGGNGAAPHGVPIDTPDPDATVGLAGPASNVARLYRAFVNDRARGTTETPSFDDAVELHRLLDGIERGHLP